MSWSRNTTAPACAVVAVLAGLLVSAVAVMAGIRPAAASGGLALRAVGRSVSWQGGPLSGTDGGAYEGVCAAPACQSTPVTVTVPARAWADDAGGLAVSIDWGGADPALNRNQELDLYLLDPTGAQVASSNFGAVTSQRVFVQHPAPGTYTIVVEAFDAVDLPYRGVATLASERTPVAGDVEGGRGLRFSPETIVDPQFTTGEPGLWAVPQGPVFVDAPWHLETGTSFVWRSDDGARTFRQVVGSVAPGVADPRRRPCTESLGGGDSDLVADSSGRNVMLADLEGLSVATAYSLDGGTTWRCSPAGASAVDDDRPWLVPAPGADGTGPAVDAYLLYRTRSTTGQLAGATLADPVHVQVDVTRDGGATWTAQGSVGGALVGQDGPGFAVADGTPQGSLYEVFSGLDDTVDVARSQDGGRTFAAPVVVSNRPASPATTFVAGAADAAGTLYVAWADTGAFNVLYSVSHDQGGHWSAPRQVNPPGTTAVMPWVAAAGRGDVAIAWYGTAGRVDPDSAPPSQRWYAYAARSESDAGAPGARFTVAPMSDGAVHLGEICLLGAQCATGDRSMADFFKIAIAPDGALLAVFDDSGRVGSAADGGHPASFVVAVRQTGGTGMAADVAPGVPAVGASPVGAPEPLVLTAAPTASVDPGGLHLRVTAAGGDVSGAGGGPATEAGWLFVWRAGDRVEYARAHVDAGGTTRFDGGTAPVPVGDTTGFSYVTYPPQVSLSGTVDGVAGSTTVTVTVPPALLSPLYRVRPGDALRGLQAFSYTGTATGAEGRASAASGTGTTGPLDVVDSTEAWSVRLGDTVDGVASGGSGRMPAPVPVLRTLPDTAGGTTGGPATPAALAAVAAVRMARRRRTHRAGRR